MNNSDFLLPELPGGAAQLLRWLVAPGATVAPGDGLLVVLTPLAEVVLPAPAAAALAEVLVDEGETVEPGTPLARLSPLVATAPAAPAPEAPRKPRLTPLARRIAAAMQLDPASLGNGRAGRVRKADVLASVSDRRPQTADRTATQGRRDAETQRGRPIREGRNATNQQSSVGSQPRETPSTQYAVRSMQQLPIPVATSSLEVHMGAVVAYCSRHRPEFERRRLRLDELTCVAYAAIATLLGQPLLNAMWSEDGIVLRRRLHVQLADVVVPDASDLTLRGLVRQSQSMQQALEASATFSIHPGSGHIGAAHLPPGQSAALLLGTTLRQAVVIDDAVAIRPVLLLTLAYDGRVLNFGQAGQFLSSVQQCLEHFA